MKKRWKGVLGAAAATPLILSAAACTGTGATPGAAPSSAIGNVDPGSTATMSVGDLPPRARQLIRNVMNKLHGVQIAEVDTDKGAEAVGLGIRYVTADRHHHRNAGITIAGFVISPEGSPKTIQADLHTLRNNEPEINDDTNGWSGRLPPIEITHGKYAGMKLVLFQGTNPIPPDPKAFAFTATLTAANLMPLNSSQVLIDTLHINSSRGVSVAG